MATISASQSWATDSTSVLSTDLRSKVEWLMTLSTSAVAVCCWRDCRSSLSRPLDPLHGEERHERGYGNGGRKENRPVYLQRADGSHCTLAKRSGTSGGTRANVARLP